LPVNLRQNLVFFNGHIIFEDENLYSMLMSESIQEILSKQDKKTLVLWATDCAEHVLPYFEEKYPKDNRPRKAIEAGRAWVRGEIAMSEARTAAFAAHVAGHAVHAATYAAKASINTAKECNWQYQHLLVMLERLKELRDKDLD